MPYGRVYFTSSTISVVNNEGNFVVFPSVDCIDEFMSSNNYASLTHQIAGRGPFLESPDN